MNQKEYRQYVPLAYKVAILHTIQRYLRDYVEGDLAPIVCEQVFGSDQEVTKDAVLDFLEELKEWEAEVEREMDEYEFKRKEARNRPRRSSKGSNETNK